MDPSLALQVALRVRLTAYEPLTELVPAQSLLDRTARPMRFPSIIIGEGQTVADETTLARDTSRVYLDVHCWALADDLAEVKNITGALREAIRDLAPWFIQDHRVVDLYIQSTRFLRDHEGETPIAHAVMTFNALLQEVATA